MRLDGGKMEEAEEEWTKELETEDKGGRDKRQNWDSKWLSVPALNHAVHCLYTTWTMTFHYVNFFTLARYWQNQFCAFL